MVTQTLSRKDEFTIVECYQNIQRFWNNFSAEMKLQFLKKFDEFVVCITAV